jgi:hypothetical protein
VALEFDALTANGTWTLCPRPLHNNVIWNKWVKLKQHADGSIERFKARLVAKGFVRNVVWITQKLSAL